MSNDTLDKVISLAKRRGFIYPGSEIYGGLANTYDVEPSLEEISLIFGGKSLFTSAPRFMVLIPLS